MGNGRPQLEIDYELLERVCQFPHKLDDIAYLMGCSIDTLERRIKERYGQTLAGYCASRLSITKQRLYGKQMELAMKGNVQLLIWIGKQLLGQSDKTMIDQNVNVTHAEREKQVLELKEKVMELIPLANIDETL